MLSTRHELGAVAPSTHRVSGDRAAGMGGRQGERRGRAAGPAEAGAHAELLRQHLPASEEVIQTLGLINLKNL